MCEVRKIPWEIPRKVVKEIIHLFPYLRKIIWQGGEVFLLDYFKDLIGEANKFPNLTHEITTNGHLITEEWIEIINKIKLDLNISIDGVTEETYEYIRKGSKFSDLLRTLNLINEAREKGRNKILVLIATVMKSNYHELERFIDFARKYRFDRVLLQPIKGNFDNEENIFYHNDKKALQYIEEVKKRMKKEAWEAGIEFAEWLPTSSGSKQNAPCAEAKEKNFVEHKGDRLFCYAPWQQMFIEWGGSVYPHCLCIQDGLNENKEVGNVLEDTLSEIWNGESMQVFRKKIMENDFLNSCNPDCLSGLICADLRNIHLEL